MNKLLISGDSYASLDKDQPENTSWSELLSNELHKELVNIARPAASNISIAIQINWITETINKDDFCIIFLTDHYRITIPTDIITNLNLFKLHDTHPKQKQQNYNSSITSGTINNPANDKMKYIFENCFDKNFQYFVDRNIIENVLNNLYKKTLNVLIVKGGFGRHIQNADIRTNFQILEYDWEYINALSRKGSSFINHLDLLGHTKLFSIIYSKIKDTFQIRT